MAYLTILAKLYRRSPNRYNQHRGHSERANRTPINQRTELTELPSSPVSGEAAKLLHKHAFWAGKIGQREKFRFPPAAPTPERTIVGRGRGSYVIFF